MARTQLFNRLMINYSYEAASCGLRNTSSLEYVREPCKKNYSTFRAECKSREKYKNTSFSLPPLLPTVFY